MKVIRRSEQARADRYPGVPRYPLADASLGSSGLHVGDLTYEPGSEVPHHVHPDAEETQIMLSGELECWLDGKRFTARGGDVIVARPGVGHAFFNRSSIEPARMVTLFAISPPTTDHTQPPDIEDERSPKNVMFGAWPDALPFIYQPRQYPAGSAAGASETASELIIIPDGSEHLVSHDGAREYGLFCVEGGVIISEQPGGADTEIADGDFVLSSGGEITIRNPRHRAARLLAVYTTR